MPEKTPYVQKPCTGSLWPNDRKTEDRHPDHTGTLVLPDGTECFLDAWVKTTKGSAEKPPREYLSISIKPKNVQRQAGAERPAARPAPPGRAALPTRPTPTRPPPAERPAPPQRDEYRTSQEDDIPF